MFEFNQNETILEEVVKNLALARAEFFAWCWTVDERVEELRRLLVAPPSNIRRAYLEIGLDDIAELRMTSLRVVNQLNAAIRDYNLICDQIGL